MPADLPQVPLQRDLATQAKRLRLAVRGRSEALELDLRKPNDLERSLLLHRLRLLGIDWGTPLAVTVAQQGTFHEWWNARLVAGAGAGRVIDAPAWGNTVAAAATHWSLSRAAATSAVDQLAALLGQLHRWRELAGGDSRGVLAALEHRAARRRRLRRADARAADRLGAAPATADVRQTDAALVRHLIDGLVAFASHRPARRVRVAGR